MKPAKQGPGLIIALVGAVVSSLVGIIYLMRTSRPAQSKGYYAPDLPRPMAVAHQGGDRVWPGNTLFAFQKAVELGVDAIETDMHMTSDGVLVISHDPTVDRISNGTGKISEMTFAELKSLDAAYKWSPDGGKTFPYRGQGITYASLEEVFQALPNTRFNIDMKQSEPPIEAAFCATIRKYGMQNKVLSASFDHKNTSTFRKLCPEVTTSGDQLETTAFVALNFLGLGRAFSPEFQSFQVPTEQYGIPVITRRFVEAAHERNLRVDVWTIDDPDEMRRLAALGVDAIMSDRPDLLMQVLGR